MTSNTHAIEIDEDWEEWDPSKGSFVVHMFAGSCAGLAEHIGMFPVDTIKVRECHDHRPTPNFIILCQTHLQVSQGRQPARAVVKQMYREGFGRLWRGAPAMAVACIPSHAAYFSVYEQAKKKFRVNEPGHHPLGAAAAGALATVLHDGVITPMDVVKQRLQLGYYSGVRDCIKSIIREEGFSALFRSYPTTVLMNIPYASVVVATNETLKEFLNPDGQHDMMTYLLSGAGAGALAAVATNPLDVIKTRLQTQTCIRADCDPGTVMACQTTPCNLQQHAQPELQRSTFRCTQSAAPYIGLRDTAMRILAEDGWSGFFRGAGARLLVHTPAMAISWGTYEAVKKALS